ncbi:MAG: hypothetical protein RH916_05035 [Vicingaceae bacterium]
MKTPLITFALVIASALAFGQDRIENGQKTSDNLHKNTTDVTNKMTTKSSSSKSNTTGEQKSSHKNTTGTYNSGQHKSAPAQPKKNTNNDSRGNAKEF